MRRQRDINYNMRTILVDWLVEVAEEYRLTRETLFIAVGYIDRFLSEMAVQRGKLQLVGVTCMLLAAKYEEIHPPSMEDFVYITDNTYSRDQVIKMEHVILKVLKFDMGACTVLTFLDQFLATANADQDASFFSQVSAFLKRRLGHGRGGGEAREAHHPPPPASVAHPCLPVGLQYLAELSLQDGQNFLPFRPSSIAAASVVLALHTFGHPHKVRF
jgi:cyclin A